MTKSYVAFFPELDENHWIHGFRAQHDPKANLVAPHMTLVFPQNLLPPTELENHAEQVVATLPKFKVHLRSALVIPEDTKSTQANHIFLVPDEGFTDIVHLHDLLYSTKLKTTLRSDLPFVPHLTIGSDLPLEDAEELVEGLLGKGIDLEFSVGRLHVVEILDPLKNRVLRKPLSLK